MWKGSLVSFTSAELERIRAFAREHSDRILDILVYGSTVRGRRAPGDLDVLVVLRDVTSQEYVDIPYRLRKVLEKERGEGQLDVKGVKTEEFLDPNYLARTRVLIEAYSLLHDDFLCKRFGLAPHALFTFDLKGLTRSEKTRFHYAMKGRSGEPGVLDELGGVHLGRGVVLVPINAAGDFCDLLELWNVGYEVFYGMAEERILERKRSPGARPA
ncbi:MAG: nucleotidyltransferase domain-containing protein [Candidatus Undinarchaeales archaeon]|nr:nucleotidyltransferase domain-containing protein [Candidatus Undinarchaeales archaeon]MDP7494412.1 nucleotidyltransferase domain-containing protein [Candidatus Undinarchaeales archaeon]